MSYACRQLGPSSSWTLGSGSLVVGNTAGGSASGMGGALLAATLGSCDPEGRPQLQPSIRRLVFQDTALQDNRAGGGGGALAVRGLYGPEAAGWPVGHVAVSVAHCSITGNTAGRLTAVAPDDRSSSVGGAVLAWAPQPRPPASVLARTPAGGNATGSAAGAEVPACHVSLSQGSVVEGNAASGDGGAVALGGCRLVAEGVRFSSNTAGGGGGAAAVLPLQATSTPNVRIAIAEPVLQDGTLSGKALRAW